MAYDETLPKNVSDAFDLFQARVADLRKRGFVKKTRRVHLDLFPQTSDAPIEGLDEDYLRSFLTTLRQFTLNDDPVHIFSVHNMFFVNCTDDNLRKWVAYARRLWQETLKSKPFVFKSLDTDYDVEKTLDLFFYGGLAHSHPDKSKELQNLPVGYREFMTFSMITAFGRLIHALNIISICIKHLKTGTESDAPEFGAAESQAETTTES